jgi:SPP1 gp7 family putative phage head morphogenesis protein
MSTPAELYRNAIDLNRYSNSVSKQIIRSYNDLLVDTCQRLAGLDTATAPVKAQRLTAILGQLKTGLTQWAGDSTALSIAELEDLAGVQAGFVEEQLKKALPKSAQDLVKSVEISPRFAEAAASFDPTERGIVSLSDDLEAAVSGASETVRVTFRDGVSMTLPNGQVLKKSFENMAEREAAAFGQAVRNGFLTGESTESITRRLIGRLQQGDSGSISQLLRAGGAATTKANNQIRTVVRTSINQVANAASMKTYEANQDITKKYRYTATLDSRTSPICRALDGTEHFYGKGPIPPQHFNCRSTTVPIIDYEGLKFDPPPPSKIGRPNSDKNIPDGETYGAWLKRQPRETQEKVLGDKGQVGYFNALSRKYGPDGAIRRFVREDGSEKTIDDLKRAYGPVSKIKAKPKPKATIAKQKAEVQKSIAKAEKKVAATGLADQIAAKQKEFKKLNYDIFMAKTPKETSAAVAKAQKVKKELEALKLKDPAYVAKQKAAEKAWKKELKGELTKAENADLPAALAKAKPPREALKRYTGETYREMRAEQFRQAKKAGKKLSAFEDAQIKIHKKNGLLADEAAEIESFLKRAPKHKGEVYRTMITDQEGLEGMLAGFKGGKQTLAMESWTSDSTLEFAQGRGQRVMLRTQNKKGVDISQLSEFEKESEVLMPKGVKYRLKSVTKEEISARATKEGRFSWIVDLEQL